MLVITVKSQKKVAEKALMKLGNNNWGSTRARVRSTGQIVCSVQELLK